MADDGDVVRAANQRFYRAFESLTLEAMEPLWAHRDYVTCVHPGWPRLSGWGAVRDSWAAIFRSTHEIRFTLTEVQVEVNGDLAWVLCTENILSQARGNVSATVILATNIFERRGAEWLVVHHHASHILATPADQGSEPN